jgi:hypothetical protein
MFSRFQRITYRFNPKNVGQIMNFKPTRIATIKIDYLRFESELRDIKLQKTVSGIAWAFYPSIEYFTGVPMSFYSPVCSTFHLTIVYNYINQIGYEYYVNEFKDKKYWVNRKNQLIVEEPSITNIHWPKFDIESFQISNVNAINMSKMTKKEKEFSVNVLLKRRIIFRTGLAICIILALNTKFCNAICIPPTLGNIMGSLLFSGVIYLNFKKQLNIKPRCNVYNKDFKYYYIDVYGNIVFTNEKYGFRTRYETSNDASTV